MPQRRLQELKLLWNVCLQEGLRNRNRYSKVVVSCRVVSSCAVTVTRSFDTNNDTSLLVTLVSSSVLSVLGRRAGVGMLAYPSP
jgi:hypothetical protein